MPIVWPALLMTLVTAAPLEPSLTVSAQARSIQPGELVVLTVTTASPVGSIQVTAFGRDLVAFNVDPATWRVLVGIDLGVAPGTYAVTVRAGSATALHRLLVTRKAFPTRQLKVDDAFVNPPAAALTRIDEEARLLASLWTASAETRLWLGPFVRPVPQAANSAFGSRSVLNGTPRSAHGGADFASPTGTPVRAPNRGRVLLARPLYYTGNTVVLDHGAGLISLFAHLSSVAAREDDTVDQGFVIGEVGATGRVTGPHLHWAVRAGTARIDPLALIELLGVQRSTVDGPGTKPRPGTLKPAPKSPGLRTPSPEPSTRQLPPP